MNQPQENRNDRWLKFSLATLVVLNIALMATLWLPRLKPAPAPEKEKRGMGGQERQVVQQFMEDSLSLTPEQRAAMARLRDAHFRKADTLRKEINLLRRQIMEEVFAASPDRGKVERLASQLGEDQANLEKMTYHHFSDLFGLCQPDQKRKFKAMIGDVLDRLKPPPPLRPAGRGRGEQRPVGGKAEQGTERPSSAGPPAEGPSGDQDSGQELPPGPEPGSGQPDGPEGGTSEVSRVQKQVARLRAGLGLSDQQAASLRPIVERFARQIDELRSQAPSGDPHAQRQQEKAIKDQRDEAIAALLTEEQKARFEEMKKERRGPTPPPPGRRR